MQKILIETVQIKTNEIELLKQQNETINKQCKTTVQSIELPQKSEEYKKLELNLNKTKLLVNNLNNFENQSIKELNEHCSEQKRLIHLKSELKIKNLENITQTNKKRKYDETNNQEQKIDQINKSNKELIEVINSYEQTCIREFLHKIKSIKVSFNKLVEEANTFLNHKQAYLKQKQTNHDEIRIFNFESIELQSNLNKELKKIKNLIYNKNKIEFINDTDESIMTPLGYFDYDKCFKVWLFIISF